MLVMNKCSDAGINGSFQGILLMILKKGDTDQLVELVSVGLMPGVMSVLS